MLLAVAFCSLDGVKQALLFLRSFSETEKTSACLPYLCISLFVYIYL